MSNSIDISFSTMISDVIVNMSAMLFKLFELCVVDSLYLLGFLLLVIGLLVFTMLWKSVKSSEELGTEYDNSGRRHSLRIKAREIEQKNAEAKRTTPKSPTAKRRPTVPEEPKTPVIVQELAEENLTPLAGSARRSARIKTNDVPVETSRSRSVSKGKMSKNKSATPAPTQKTPQGSGTEKTSALRRSKRVQ